MADTCVALSTKTVDVYIALSRSTTDVMDIGVLGIMHHSSKRLRMIF